MCRHHTNQDDRQKQDDIYLSGLEPMPRPDLKGKKNARPSPKILRRQKWHKTTRGPRAVMQVAA